jgi:undecaprenyl-diphosphatase
MNFVDFEVIRYLNQFSQHSWIFDKVIGITSNNSLLKGGVLATIIWWAWFKREDRHSHYREHIISTLFGCVVAIALARVLALTLPFRLRPLHEESLHFLLPYGETLGLLEKWSSFPSDHAVLFFTISAGLLFIQRSIGVFALFYSVLFVAFPRVYFGLHYPSDIIAGAIIGVTIALIANRYLVENKYTQSIVTLSQSVPSLFYPLFFVFTFQIAEMFNGSRALISGMFKLVHRIIA